MALKRSHRLLFWIATIAVMVFGAVWIFSPSVNGAPADLVINEILASNGAGLTDEDGDYSDWIEIYNRSNQPVNLSGWALTDDLNQPAKWPFPAITLSSREYVVVFASGKNRRSTEPGSPLHTNFKLNKAGEPLALYNILDASFKDTISPQFPLQFRDIAYGRYGNQLAFGYLGRPTPGDPNDETLFWTDFVSRVEFSQPRGFYDAPFLLELSTATPEATIRFTTDGREPTETNGAIYTGPIPIDHTMVLRAVAFKPDLLPSYVDTQTYLFLDDVLTQPPNPPGYPLTWGVHGEDSEKYGYLDGAPVQADYEMDPTIVNDPRYRDTIKEDLKSIPTLSLVTDVQHFADLYANPKERGRAWERPVSVELIDPDNDNQGFQINAGLRIQGEAGRRDYMPKHPFRLFFRGEYGATQLEYPLFPDSPVDTFNTLTLRSGVNRSYAGRPGYDHRLATYTRDEWLRASQIVVSGAGSHGIFVHLYINGLYWGLYNVVERPDAAFLASYFGGQKEDWYSANHTGTVSGSDVRLETLRTLAQSGAFDDPEKYATLQTFVDIPQFIDFIILNWYAGNIDWGHTNWYLGVQNPSGRIMFFVWDAETTWDDGASLHLGNAEPQNLVKPFFEGLMGNSDFRLAFADRLYQHLFNDGPLTDANAQARWLDINATIDRAIVAESARWGDARYQPPITRDDWLEARDAVLAQMDGNVAKLIALTREAGYYPPLGPPVFNQPGGLIPPGFHLTMRLEPTTLATIYYTIDGADPRQAGTGVAAPEAIEFDTPLVLTTTTLVKARAFSGDPATGSGVWSALNKASFRVVERDSKLRITEIMYNPSDSDDYEFIELRNVGEAALDLAGFRVEGIRFIFPPNVKPLAPGQFTVLVRDRAAFTKRYPDVPIGGVYDGQLSNSGEIIILKDQRDQTILRVEYDDDNGWPVSPDGRGDSLVLVNPNGDPNDPKNWRASLDLNGSPGADEPVERFRKGESKWFIH